MEEGNSSRNNGKAIMKPSIPPLPPTARPTAGTSKARQNLAAAATTSRRGRPPTPLPPPPLPPASPSISDQLLPIANVIRIMRKALPPHAKISDEAKIAIQESVTEFISFVTEEANQRCRNEQRKTITGDDVLCSMDSLGFDNYVDPLTRYLQKYREMEGLHNPRRQIMLRPSLATQHMGGLMPGPTVTMPTMPTNLNNNVGVFAATGPQNCYTNEPGSSAAAPPPPAAAYVPSIPAASEVSCSSLIDRINFDVGSYGTQDEVNFDSIELTGEASPSASTSAGFMAAEDDSFDPFSLFK